MSTATKTSFGPVRIATFAIGLDTYWRQYDGLLDEVMGNHACFVNKLRSRGVAVHDFDMVDNAHGAQALLPKLVALDPDLLMVDMVTYGTSATIGVIARAMRIPIVLVALQPRAAMDYENATTYMQLCNDNICAMPEFCHAIARMGAAVPACVIGTLEDDPEVEAELDSWMCVARVLYALRHARIGHIGHPLEAMYDMHTDQAAITRWFGPHIVQCEVGDLAAQGIDIGDDELEKKKHEILSFFDTPDPGAEPHAVRLTPEDLIGAARAAIALDRFIDAEDLQGLAYYYQAQAGSELRSFLGSLIVGNSLLCGRGFPMCGESDLKTCLAMFIMDRLGAGASFTEFHPIDFVRDTVLVGHDGPHDVRVAEGKPVLRSLRQYHGKPGAGASVEFQLRTGPVTLFGITTDADGRFRFLVAEGESVRGPIPATGNTNTHLRVKGGVRRFLKDWFAEGPTHHFALGLGYRARDLERIADALKIECVVIRRGTDGEGV